MVLHVQRVPVSLKRAFQHLWGHCFTFSGDRMLFILTDLIQTMFTPKTLKTKTTLIQISVFIPVSYIISVLNEEVHHMTTNVRTLGV